jgi:endonuclease/exonuclease/phosphatase family metal-dependent hydrolase
LQESFSLSCPAGGCAFTIPVKAPKRAIDFFAFNSTFKDLFQFKESQAMVGEEASDHLPHVANFLILD